MTSMFAPLQWTDIATRLALTVLVGLLIGYNRSEQGKAAGMRTTLMVCLAASVAMIQVNLLLPMAGRPSSSFVMNDLMRLPLGILTGVGFIGGGAILRRGSLVVGVTTAATLWLVTVIGLCLGGGQIELGLAATALGLFALWVLKWIESILLQEQRARFSIEIDEGGLTEAEIRRRLSVAGLTITASHVVFDRASRRGKLVFDTLMTRLGSNTATPAVIKDLAHEISVIKLEWDGLVDTDTG
jgi:putative Mg2+ transporter-C (MgtC) family protein